MAPTGLALSEKARANAVPSNSFVPPPPPAPEGQRRAQAGGPASPEPPPAAPPPPPPPPDTMRILLAFDEFQSAVEPPPLPALPSLETAPSSGQVRLDPTWPQNVPVPPGPPGLRPCPPCPPFGVTTPAPSAPGS